VLAVLAELQPEESSLPQGFVHQAEEAFVPNPVVPDPVVPAHQLSKRMQRGVSCVVLRRLSSRVVLRRLSSQRLIFSFDLGLEMCKTIRGTKNRYELLSLGCDIGYYNSAV
jgi:hypothetical protein